MKTQFLALLAAGLLLLGGCKKDADLIEADCAVDESGTVASVLAKYAVPVQEFVIQPASPNSFVTAANHYVYVPAGLRKINGQALSISPIKVSVREVMKRSEMIFSHTPTVASGQRNLLESGGMFNITFKQDDQQLEFRNNARLVISTDLPRALSTTNGMQLFVGVPDSSTRSQIASWNQITPSQDTATFIMSNAPLGVPGFSVSLGSAIYNNNLRSLNWINCDRFVTAFPVTRVLIQATKPTITSQNTEVFLVFNTLNSVLQAYPTTGNTFLSYQIPVGYSVTAIVLHKDAGQLYFGKQTATVAANQVFAPTLREVTEAELVAEIQQL